MAITLNDNSQINAPKPIDSRYFDPATGQTPWIDVASALAWIWPTIRYQWLTVNIAGTEYRFKDGITDLDFVEKTSGSSASERKFVYTRTNIIVPNIDLSIVWNYTAQSKTKWNKDIFTAYSWINSIYLSCFFDLIEIDSNGVEITKHEWLRFTSEAELFDYMLNNCSVTWTVANYNIIAEVYDIIDDTIPEINRMNLTNTFYNILKWKWRSKSSASRDLTLPSMLENEKIDTTFYINFIEQVINTVLPEFGATYVYNALDLPERVIRSSRNWKWRFNLYGDNNPIRWNITDRRRCIRWFQNFLNEANTPNRWTNSVKREILHNESFYIYFDLNTFGFWFIAKNNMEQLTSYLANNSYSVCVVYKTHCNYLWDDYYACMIKPVSWNELWISWFDQTKYRIEAITQDKNWYAYLRQPIVQYYFWEVQWVARIDKVNLKGLLFKDYQLFTKKNTRKANFILRDLVTNKVSRLSKKHLEITSGRDRPQSFSLSK